MTKEVHNARMASRKDWSLEIFVGILAAATIVSLFLIDYNEGLLYAVNDG